MSDVHTVAHRYLQDLKRGKCSFYAPPDNENILPLAETIVDRVLVMRKEKPQYLVGVKPSGRLVFTHDVRLAASYDSTSLLLVDVLRKLEDHRIDFETMPATWFSNHQNG